MRSLSLTKTLLGDGRLCCCPLAADEDTEAWKVEYLLSFNCNYNLAHPIIYYPGLSPGVEVQLPPQHIVPNQWCVPTQGVQDLGERRE